MSHASPTGSATAPASQSRPAGPPARTAGFPAAEPTASQTHVAESDSPTPPDASSADANACSGVETPSARATRASGERGSHCLKTAGTDMTLPAVDTSTPPPRTLTTTRPHGRAAIRAIIASASAIDRHSVTTRSITPAGDACTALPRLLVATSPASFQPTTAPGNPLTPTSVPPRPFASKRLATGSAWRPKQTSNPRAAAVASAGATITTSQPPSAAAGSAIPARTMPPSTPAPSAMPASSSSTAGSIMAVRVATPAAAICLAQSLMAAACSRPFRKPRSKSLLRAPCAPVSTAAPAADFPPTRGSM